MFVAFVSPIEQMGKFVSQIRMNSMRLNIAKLLVKLKIVTTLFSKFYCFFGATLDTMLNNAIKFCSWGIRVIWFKVVFRWLSFDMR